MKPPAPVTSTRRGVDVPAIRCAPSLVMVKCVAAENRHGSSRTGAAEHSRHRMRQNQQIQRERPLIDVVEVHLDPIVESNCAATVDLPETGHTGPHTEAPQVT